MVHSTSHPVPNKLHSQLLHEDVSLRHIVEEFVGGLPNRLTEMRAAYERMDWERLRMLAHQLKGAGGSYGYPELSLLARELEEGSKLRRAAGFADRMVVCERLTAAARAGLDLDLDLNRAGMFADHGTTPS